MVLGFSIDGLLTRLAIFSAVNFFILESAPPFIENLVTLFGLVHFENWMEGDLVLDGFLTRLIIFSAINFFTLFYLVHFEDWIEGDLLLGFLADGFLTRVAIFFSC